MVYNIATALIAISIHEMVCHPIEKKVEIQKLNLEHHTHFSLNNRTHHTGSNTNCIDCPAILIRKKRFWWGKKEETTTEYYTSTAFPEDIPIEKSIEDSDSWSSWFSNVGSSIKQGFKKVGRKVKSGVNKIRNSFSRTEDKFTEFVDNLKERVARGDGKAIRLLRKLGIVVKYDEEGHVSGSEVDSGADNVEDTLSNEGMLIPATKSPDLREQTGDFSTSTIRGREAVQKITTTSPTFYISTPYPFTTTYMSNISSKPTGALVPYSITSYTNTEITPTSSNRSPIVLSSSVWFRSTESPSTYTSRTSIATTSPSSPIVQPTFITPKTTTELPFRTTKSSSRLSTPAIEYNSPSNPSIQSTSTGSVTTKRLSTMPTFSTTQPSIGASTGSSAFYSGSSKLVTSAVSTTLGFQHSSTTQPVSVQNSPITSTTESASTKNSIYISDQPTTTFITSNMQTTAEASLSTPAYISTTASVASFSTTPESETTGIINPTTHAPSTTSSTIDSNFRPTVEISTLATGPTTPPPFPDIFKETGVRNRLHDIFLNADFDHNDLKGIFETDPDIYDEYYYDY